MPQLTGNIVYLIRREIYPGTVTIADGRIARIDRFGNTPADDSRHNGSLPFLLPGFIDSHVHIESSMLSPALYGHTALGHGTVAVVADPHEIANVCGTDGIRYMVEQARRTPLKIHYTVPSCVPATPFETSGATLDSRTVEELLESGVFVALGEMMNYPGVLGGDDQCIRKIEAARRRGIPVDGHAPLLEGADLRRYIGTGISTDHESCSLREAREKIDAGMMIQIREGSQSREFDTLIPLLGYRPDRVMLCTDDLKASGLSRGHINRLVSRAIALGYDLFDVLAAATLNPIRHYRLKVGLLQPGDPADLICCPDLIHFTPSQVWIDGKRVDTLPAPGTDRTVNHFLAEPITTGIIATSSAGNELLRVIRPEEGTLITGEELIPAGEKGRYQKMIVLNRYAPHAPAAIGYVSGFNLQDGAFGSTIAHDSHNLIVTGSSDELIVQAANRLIAMQGGIVCCDRDTTTEMPLPVGGLMSDADLGTVIRQYDRTERHIHALGCPFSTPVMQLAFLALPVIPSLRLTDRGLFDATRFEFV